MSRIDDALRRAKGGEQAVGGAEAGEGDARPPVPESQVFQPAWDVSSEEGARREDDAESVVRRLEAHVPPAVRSDAQGGERQLLSDEGPRTLAIFKGFHPQVTERLALPSSGHAGLVEQFRKLAATLHHAQTATGIKTVMITSAVAGEGKTLTATNLAITLAESFRRNVLLVDADLRRPSMHDVFQVPNVSGLSDGLKAPTEGKLSLIQVSSLLTLLTAGRPDPDPMHSLISARMRRVIEEARAKFDWVLLDTPPVGLLTDANLLAAMVDGALLVVRAGTTPFTFVERASEILGRERIVGVVLNAVMPEEARDHDNYYRYYNYSSYNRASSMERRQR